ncbi:transposase [Sphingobium sp. 15-1]|uniref:transposase n=1 Tax=Sphingobium sp. 15-1 TaxID=2729616 RepID=UPI00350FC4D4
MISGPERRRAWTAEQKEALVLAACAPGAVVADIARAADVHPRLIHRWRREVTQRVGPSGSGTNFVPVVMKDDASAKDCRWSSPSHARRPCPGHAR